MTKTRNGSIAYIALAFAAAIACFWAGTGRAADIETGPVLIVAHEELGGPYAETVSIAAPFSGGHIGVVINRPIDDVTLRDAVEEKYLAKENARIPVFLGGFTNEGRLFALIASSKKPDATALKMGADLWLAVDRRTIDRLLRTPRANVRYFIGVVLWSPGKMASEIEDKMVYVLPPADASILKRPPQTLWKELADKERAKKKIIKT